MAEVMGTAQDLVTLATLTSALLVFSPWLLLMLVCAVLPAFLGETHFASLSYSLLYRWTPQRRELDYLRWLGATQESAKDLGRGSNVPCPPACETVRFRECFVNFVSRRFDSNAMQDIRHIWSASLGHLRGLVSSYSPLGMGMMWARSS